MRSSKVFSHILLLLSIMKKIFFLFLTFQSLFSSGQIATIPFIEEGLVFIKVKVNDHDKSLHFVFDTGASAAVLDAGIAKDLGISSSYSSYVQGASGSENYKIATEQKIVVGSLELMTNLVLVDLQALNNRSDIPVDGIIGYDILSQFVTEFDFEKDEILLYKNTTDINHITDFKKYKMTLNGPIPQVELNVTLKNGKQLKGNFLFDSGANLTILFNTPFAKKHKLSDKINKTYSYKSQGLTSTSGNIGGTVTAIDLFDFSFGEIPISLSQATAGVTSSSGYAGILGADIINRFNMVLDYGNRRFYFKSNAAFHNPFDYPLTGFSLEKKEDIIIISQISEKSDAYGNGVRPGDQVKAINGQSYITLEAYRTILKKEGQSVILQLVSPDGQTKEITIELKRLI